MWHILKISMLFFVFGMFPHSLMNWAQSNDAKLFLVGPTQEAIAKPIVISNDGVTDANGKCFNWPVIVDAQLLGEQSEPFQQARETVGEPLFRIDRRLKAGEWSGLDELAERLAAVNFSDTSGNQARVRLAALHGLLHTHRNEAAAAELLNLLGVPGQFEVVNEYPKSIISPAELRNGFCENLLPRFFDRGVARNLIAKNKEKWLAQQSEWSWGSRVYFAALLLAAEELENAQSFIDKWDVVNSPELREWKQIFGAQIEIAHGRFGEHTIALESQLSQLSGSAKLCGQYCLAQDLTARAKTESQHRQALLRWLEIAAISRQHQSGLAAAALNAAIVLARDRGWEFEREGLRTELLKNHADTYHGRQLLKERND